MPKTTCSALLFLILFCHVSHMHATAAKSTQDPDRRGDFEAGFRAGVNSANMWSVQGADPAAESQTGFAGGLFIGIPLSRTFGLQPELNISQKGYRQGSLLVDEARYSFERSTTYLDLPLYLQVKPNEFLTLLLGFQYAFLLHSQDEFNLPGEPAMITDPESDHIRDHLGGFNAGIDLHFQRFVVSARTGWDLRSNSGRIPEMEETGEFSYKNTWLQFTLGFKFN